MKHGKSDENNSFKIKQGKIVIRQLDFMLFSGKITDNQKDDLLCNLEKYDRSRATYDCLHIPL